MGLTYATYLEDDGLRAEIHRRAARARADEMQQLVAWLAGIARRLPRSILCRSYAFR